MKVLSRIFQRQRQRPEQDVLEAAIRAASEAGREAGWLQAVTEHWQSYAGFDTGREDTLHLLGTPERAAFEEQPLFAAAVLTLTALVVGDGVTYGTLDDPAAQTALEEWYALNKLADYSIEMFINWLLDGELLVLLALNGSRTEPAWVNIWDTRLDGVTINHPEGNPRDIQSVRVGGRTVQPEGFVWRSNTRWNRLRGVSTVRTAVKPACDYTRLGDLRMRAHELRGRINAIYYAFAKTAKELEAKASRYRKLPTSGNVLTIQMDPETGQSEKVDFTNPRTDASDAESDVRMLIRTVGMVFGLPEHFLAVGDTANLATAKAMSEPMIRRVEGHQELIRGVLTELFQKELVRRYGPTRTYLVRRREIVNGRYEVVETRVPAEDLEIPLNFPPVIDEGDTDLERIKYGHSSGLISDETATEELGFDPALEAERLANDDEEDPVEDPFADPEVDPDDPDPEEDEGAEP